MGNAQFSLGSGSKVSLVDIWQKTTKFCKATILQLKKKKDESYRKSIGTIAFSNSHNFYLYAPRHYTSVSSVQLLSHVWLFATPWIAACQASLSTSSRSLLKLMSIELMIHPAISSSVIPFSSCPKSLPASGSFPMSQLFPWGGQSIGVSASASVLPVNSQDWSPLGWTGWISLQSKGLSRVFSDTTVQKHQFFGTQLSSHTMTHTMMLNFISSSYQPETGIMSLFYRQGNWVNRTIKSMEWTHTAAEQQAWIGLSQQGWLA